MASLASGQAETRWKVQIRRWLVTATFASISATGLAPVSSQAMPVDPQTARVLADLAKTLLQAGMDTTSEYYKEMSQLELMSAFAEQIGQLRSTTIDLEPLIRSEAVRDLYVASVSLNGRVSALGDEYQIRAEGINETAREELIDRMRGLRTEAQKLAFDATPIQHVSGDDGIQFLLALRSIMVSVGLLEAVERGLGSYSQSSLVYASIRSELGRLTDGLEDNLAAEERMAREGAAATNALLATLAQDEILRPLVNAVRNGDLVMAHCVESRDSTFDQLTPVDICIGSKDKPVKIKSRIDRETGKTLPGRNTYGCVRYVREIRTYHLEPVYRGGALIGGKLELADRNITYHPRSDQISCPIQREMFESNKDWVEIEAAWGRSLDRVYDTGANVALAKARKALIDEVKQLNVVLWN